ncbi:unnamed protein product [Microthlaspi erraticum]|uniref:Uncharacterized protein n=1 Tax=Microthlaspi erraticum TaxID=1685480 RepID=A0A6D2KJW3_9BRAS|nr:unnamed protein product [Microthlaspi erraticum]
MSQRCSYGIARRDDGKSVKEDGRLEAGDGGGLGLEAAKDGGGIGMRAAGGAEAAGDDVGEAAAGDDVGSTGDNERDEEDSLQPNEK